MIPVAKESLYVPSFDMYVVTHPALNAPTIHPRNTSMYAVHGSEDVNACTASTSFISNPSGNGNMNEFTYSKMSMIIKAAISPAKTAPMFFNIFMK